MQKNSLETSKIEFKRKANKICLFILTEILARTANLFRDEVNV